MPTSPASSGSMAKAIRVRLCLLAGGMRTGGFALASYQGWACSLRLARSATLHVSKSKTSERRTPSQFDQNHCNSQKTNEAMPLSIKAMAARPKTMGIMEVRTQDQFTTPRPRGTWDTPIGLCPVPPIRLLHRDMSRCCPVLVPCPAS